MREATGGSLLLYLIIPIIFLFIVFIGFIMNYASAYRSANYVVTQLETCGGSLDSCGHTSLSDVKEYIKNKYHYLDDINVSCTPNAKGIVCQVSLGVKFEFPIIGGVNIYTVKAETKTIYDN